MSSTCHIGPSHLPNIFHGCRSSKTRGQGGWWNAEGDAGVAARTDQAESWDEKTELCFDKILRSFTYSSFITLPIARNKVEFDLRKRPRRANPTYYMRRTIPSRSYYAFELSFILSSLPPLAHQDFCASIADFLLQKSHKILSQNI